MKKRYLIALVTAFCLVAVVVCIGCSSNEAAETEQVTYSSNSLIAFHESNGKDISALTEVSVENCSECHGDLIKIQADTESALVVENAEVLPTANPHKNHMTKDISCSDCHSLTEASTLMCNTSCHRWKLAMNNGTWQGTKWQE